MNLNRAMIIGNLTRDPESRTTPSGQSVCNFSVATSSQWTDSQGQKQERTEYHPIVAWGKLADICQQYLAKGRKVYVEGRLQTREWEAQDGAKKQRTEIVAENMIILDRAGAGGAPAAGQPPAPSSPSKIDQGVGDQEIRVEDIPF
ncbi:single-stranded DNA-binding protein [Candidatus Uhrbacteria bacterium]|nr:single-stranded DNA-binding protein [Candidatus Uhrbacteria bacterium]